jgi:hypothetical protein
MRGFLDSHGIEPLCLFILYKRGISAGLEARMSMVLSLKPMQSPGTRAPPTVAPAGRRGSRDGGRSLAPDPSRVDGYLRAVVGAGSEPRGRLPAGHMRTPREVMEGHYC